jgi:PAS domain-containing protein
MGAALLDGAGITLALVEAQVGSLVDVLPIAVLVTSPFGEILRANEAAVDLFGSPLPLVGQFVSTALDQARRKHPVTVRLRWLRHQGEVLRLYVIHEARR